MSLASNHLKIPKESQKFHRSDAREQIGQVLSRGGNESRKQQNRVILVVWRDSNFKCRIAPCIKRSLDI